MLRLVGGLAVLAILALIVLLIVVLVRNSRLSGRHTQMSSPVNAATPLNVENNALKILDERFAKGEIDEEEYNRKKEILLKK